MWNIFFVRKSAVPRCISARAAACTAPSRGHNSKLYSATSPQDGRSSPAPGRLAGAPKQRRKSGAQSDLVRRAAKEGEGGERRGERRTVTQMIMEGVGRKDQKGKPAQLVVRKARPNEQKAIDGPK